MRFPLKLALRWGLALGATLNLSAQPVSAQVDERPSNVNSAPPPPDSQGAPEFELPEVSPQPAQGALSTGLSVLVEGFEFEGHTAFTTEQLSAALSDLVGRRVESEELLAARDRITRLYIDAGYVTSGAVIPDQSVGAGRVRIRVVEGALQEIEVSGAERFQPGYFERRIEWAGRAPLNVNQLEQLLQRLQRDELVERVSARLEPTRDLGQSRLILLIVEARQEDLRLGAENDRSPSVGADAGIVNARIANLIGRRDELSLAGWFTEGLRDVNADFAMPMNRWDTRLETRVRWSESEIVESPFDVLDIESESLSVSLGVYQPVYRSRSQVLELGLRGDWRRGRSTLSGQSFCFQPGVSDCTPSTAVVRLVGDWKWQGEQRVVAARSTFSFGTDWLGATTRGGNLPDGRFFSWLGQARYAQKLPLESRLVVRADLQLTDDPLLSFERIGVGGARTVRGYRPNQLVRDSGVVASLEWRVPVWRRVLGLPYVELAPFWDIGHGWNERFDPGENTLSSLGMGLLLRPHERVEAEVYWGGRLFGVNRVGSGAIGEGVHFRVVVDAW